MTPEMYEIEERRFGGERAVYPGHGMVVAMYIMDAFQCAEDALSPSKHGWPEAVGSGAVPGAGDGAYRGVDVIRALMAGVSPEVCIERADEAWRHGVGPGNLGEDVYQKGQQQADRYRAAFVEQATAWLAEQGEVMSHVQGLVRASRRPERQRSSVCCPHCGGKL